MALRRNIPKRPVGIDAFHIWAQAVHDRVFKYLQFNNSNTIRVNERQQGIDFDALVGTSGGSSTPSSGITEMSVVAFVPSSSTDGYGNAIICGGNVIGVNITAGGTYASVPSITFAAPPSGTTATGTALLSGVTSGTLVGITITNPGTGYTNTPGATVAITIGGSGGGAATGTLNNVYVALPRQIQKQTYDGQTVVLSDNSHTYAFTGAGASYHNNIARTDATADPISGTITAVAIVWPPYIAETYAGTPVGWNMINVFTPTNGTSVKVNTVPVTLMEIGTERRWVNTTAICYAGSTAYMFTESNPSATTEP